ncbi:MAG: TlpA disulfide reductase family protein, partial [Saprospiraceae bacterium]
QYRMRAWGQTDHWVDFLIPDSLPTTLALHLDLHYEKMDGQAIKVEGLPENDLYVGLMAERDHLALRRDSLGTLAIGQMDADQAAFNRRCKAVIAAHRNSLVADVAALLIEPVPADYPNKPAYAKLPANDFAKAHALENIPFHHENILAHNAFVKSLNRYFKYFTRDTMGNTAFIEGVMSRRNGNDLVDGFLFKYLLDKMMDYRQEGGLTYLLSWYAPDCTDENPLPNSVKLLLAALKNCVPGKASVDLALPGTDGQLVKLSEVCAQHSLTLLLFWRSTCSHCREFEPELVRMYEKYHPLGLEVYALSTDRTEQDWQTFLKENPMPWINVFIPNDQRGTVAQFFPAPSTPTLISLDKNHKVISRLISRGTLEAYLEAELPKHKER